MKKALPLFLSILLIFGLAACNRPRQRNSTDTSTPAPSAAPAMAIEATQTRPPAPTDAPLEAPSATPELPQPEPSATLVPPDVSAAATAAAELDQALSDLEQFLNNMNTSVEVP